MRFPKGDQVENCPSFFFFFFFFCFPHSVTNRRLGLKTHAQVILSLHGFAWVGHFLVDDFRVFRRKTQLFEMVHRKKNYLGILTREYPATPKVTLERVDTWLRRYKMVNTRLNTIGATWLRGSVATRLRGYPQRTRHSRTVMYFYVATWLRSHRAPPPPPPPNQRNNGEETVLRVQIVVLSRRRVSGARTSQILIQATDFLQNFLVRSGNSTAEKLQV